jgi:predicted deacetylase
MSAKYIVRFDDFCPTMNWSVWGKIETILQKYDVKPLIAVVPDNHDPKLQVDEPNQEFWDKVRAWQASGWGIAIHGYQHVYSLPNSGLMRINNYSEFAGLSETEQRDKLQKGLTIFAENGIKADAWIAPAHSFDKTTVKVLLDLDINIISDGYYHRPLKRFGAIWIPQQLWRFKAKDFGLWTVCLHHNAYSDNDIQSLEKSIAKYAADIISLDQAIENYESKEINLIDYAFENFWRNYLATKTLLWPVAKRIKQILK